MTLGPLMIDVEGLQLTAAETDKLRDPRIGGVILFSRNFSSIEQVKELTRSIHFVRSPGLLIAADQEGGRVQRFRDGLSNYRRHICSDINMTSMLSWPGNWPLPAVGSWLRNCLISVLTDRKSVV